MCELKSYVSITTSERRIILSCAQVSGEELLLDKGRLRNEVAPRRAAICRGEAVPLRRSRPSAAQLPLCGEAVPPRRSRRYSRTSYIGREHDKETDLGFYGVRLYEPGYGRFLSTDVLWGAQLSLQPYHYAINNPVNASDASGLFSIGEHVEIDMAARQMAGLSTGLLAQVQSTIYHTIQDIPLSIVSSIHLDNMDNGEMQSWLSSGGYESSGAHTLQDF